jgi:ribonucleoside-triphosphate reductase
MRDIALNEIMSEIAKYNHINNRVYTHDLSHYAIGDSNCLTIPFDRLLAKGFETRQTGIRTAGSLSTALQLVAVIYQAQSLCQFGGVSAGHIDWTLVPYYRKSFWKHFRDGLEWIDNCSDISQYCDKNFDATRSIENIKFKEEHPKAYAYATVMTERELAQGVEGLLHNANSLQSRAGNQLPFSSLNYGTCTLPEGRSIIRAILEGTIKGVGPLHKTSVFPCQIFQEKKGINKDPSDPNYDLFKLACKCTAKRLYPNYANCDCSNQQSWIKQDRELKQNIIDNLTEEKYTHLQQYLYHNPEISNKLSIKLTDDCSQIYVDWTEAPEELFSTMGCRTQTAADKAGVRSIKLNIEYMIKYQKPYDDIFSLALKDGRGNCCPATIIMPTIAMEVKESLDRLMYPDGYSSEILINTFLKSLDKAIHETKDGLIERYNWICSQSVDSAKFAYENHLMAGYRPEEGIESAMRHFSLAIGQIGLAETLQILIGCDQTTEKGMKLAKRIEQLFKDRCAEFKETTGLNFGVYYTPAENLCYTSMKKFKERYGIIPNVSDKDFFTNSVHVPVWKEISPFDKIDIESQLTGYSSAGCITYVELDGKVEHNLEALEQIILYAMDKDIPYFAINVPNDTCNKCGYTGELGETCPECGSHDIERLRRVTGYLSTTYLHFNPGKIQEVQMRYKHSKKMSDWVK